MNAEISVPSLLLKVPCEHFGRLEEILATLEELSDKKGLKRIEKSLEESRKKEMRLSNSDCLSIFSR